MVVVKIFCSPVSLSRLVIWSWAKIFDETASFLRNFDFFEFVGVLGVLGVFGWCFFSGTPKWVKFAVFSILPGAGFPGDRMVEPHTDCVASWDNV